MAQSSWMLRGSARKCLRWRNFHIIKIIGNFKDFTLLSTRFPFTPFPNATVQYLNFENHEWMSFWLPRNFMNFSRRTFPPVWHIVYAHWMKEYSISCSISWTQLSFDVKWAGMFVMDPCYLLPLHGACTNPNLTKNYISIEIRTGWKFIVQIYYLIIFIIIKWNTPSAPLAPMSDRPFVDSETFSKLMENVFLAVGERKRAHTLCWSLDSTWSLLFHKCIEFTTKTMTSPGDCVQVIRTVSHSTHSILIPILINRRYSPVCEIIKFISNSYFFVRPYEQTDTRAQKYTQLYLAKVLSSFLGNMRESSPCTRD